MTCTAPGADAVPMAEQLGFGARRVVSQPWDQRLAVHLSEVRQLLDRELDELCHDWAVVTPDTSRTGETNPAVRLREFVGRESGRTGPVMALSGWVAAAGHHSGLGCDDLTVAASAVELLDWSVSVHDDFDDTVSVVAGTFAQSKAERLAALLPPAMRVIWRHLVLELLAGRLQGGPGSAGADRSPHPVRAGVRPTAGYRSRARLLQLGAAAAGADDDVLAVLAEYGQNADEAFALRDEVLGVFGDADATGGPNGEYLRSGRPTVLIALAASQLRGPAVSALHAFGSAAMTDTQARQLREAMVEQGVIAEVESMIDRYVDRARKALCPETVCTDGIAQLNRLVDVGSWRHAQ